LDETIKLHFSNEIFKLVLLFLIITSLLRIIFYAENTLVILKIVAAMFWLLILPGYCITRMWGAECSFFERVSIAIPVSIAVIGISAYYLGLVGINLKILAVALPALIIFGINRAAAKANYLNCRKKIHRYANLLFE